MEGIGKVLLAVIVIVAAFFTSLLAVHIILSIANLYALSFITSFSFVQIYGAITVLSIALYKHKPTKEEDTFGDVVEQSVKEVFTKVFFLLVSWGMAFLAYNILT